VTLERPLRPRRDIIFLTSKLGRHIDDPSLVPIDQFAIGVKDLPLDSIDTDEDLHARNQIELDTIDTYAEDMRHSDIFSAIDVDEKGNGGDSRYLLVDGRHPLEAAKCIGLKKHLGAEVGG
jgi:hypothetical protein